MKNNKILFQAILLLLFLFLLNACSSALKSANKNFESGKYFTAANLYDEALQDESLSKSEKAKLNFQVAESHRLSNNLKAAMPYYKKAKSLGYQDDNMTFYYAYGLKMTGEYDKASNLFAKYAKEGKDYELIRLAREEVKSLEEVKKLYDYVDEFIDIELCEKINTEDDEYSPTFWNNKLVYTSTTDADIIYEGTGGGFSNLYMYDFDSTEICDGNIDYFDSLINTIGFHEASATFSRDGRVMVFARSNSDKRKDEKKEVDLYESVFNGETWSEPKLLEISDPNFWDACPAFSYNDPNVLYFASNRKGGYGGLDLYRAERNYKGEWGSVRNLGRSINTSGDEMFPYAAKNAKLYFASDGHAGLGGLDLFEATQKNRKINIKNMGRPFNSTADDFSFSFYSHDAGAFSSNRKENGGDGSDNIYFFVDRTPLLKPIRYYLAGTSFGREDTTRYILANVRLHLINESDVVIDSTYSDDQGRFKFKPQLVLGEDYWIAARGVGYLKDTVMFPTADKEVSQEEVKDRPEKIIDVVLETEVEVTKDFYEQLLTEGEVSFNNILYDFDDYRIRVDAAVELDKLVEFLNEHSDVIIELGSHTDERGSDRYNERLSQQRAEAAVEYIVSRGIDPNRLVARGYGELIPVVFDAETEEEHQLNRRTTIALLEEY